MSADRQTSPGVECIIVAHNAGDLLVQAVASAVTEVGEGRVWVMDAASTDASVGPVAGRFPGVHVVAVENKGFSAGNNRGIEMSSAEWVLLLNPDALIETGSVARLLETARLDDEIAVVAPLVFNPEGRLQEGSFGRFPSVAVRMSTALARLRRRVTGSGIVPPANRTDVDWVTGACMLLRRGAIDVAGPMDERFFLYYEDVEWCHRLRDHGFRVVLEPAARCVHHLGMSDTPSGVVARAYRESFYRYCDLYGLWGLKALAAPALAARRVLGRNA